MPQCACLKTHAATERRCLPELELVANTKARLLVAWTLIISFFYACLSNFFPPMCKRLTGLSYAESAGSFRAKCCETEETNEGHMETKGDGQNHSQKLEDMDSKLAERES